MSAGTRRVRAPVVARAVAGVRRIAWLASYPKSGNTWTRVLLANFLSASDEPVSINGLRARMPGEGACSRLQFDEWTGVPASDCTDDEVDRLRPDVYRAVAAEAARDGARLFCKAHDALRHGPTEAPLFPDDVTVGAVYLVRNPLDVAVSWTFHAGHEDFAASVAMLGDPHARLAGHGANQLRQRLSDWSGHVESWLRAPFPVLRVRYEDLLADIVRQLARMAAFLRLDGATDERRLRRAAAFSDFARLRENEEREGFKERFPATRRFFRCGKAGDWRRYLSAAQARDVVRSHERVMAAQGYDPRGVLRATGQEPGA